MSDTDDVLVFDPMTVEEFAAFYREAKRVNEELQGGEDA